MSRAVALFSGGLDSSLTIRILQEQGFEVEALNIRTLFDCCRTPATLQFSGSLLLRYTRRFDSQDAKVHVTRAGVDPTQRRAAARGCPHDPHPLSRRRGMR